MSLPPPHSLRRVANAIHCGVGQRNQTALHLSGHTIQSGTGYPLRLVMSLWRSPSATRARGYFSDYLRSGVGHAVCIEHFWMSNCAEYDRLVSLVENALGNLAQLTTMLLDQFRAGEFAACTRMDKELELSVGEKERSIGALRQHMTEHKCQPREPI